MPSIFKYCVVAIAGDLDDSAWKQEKVKQWVQYWGGTFSEIVDGNVTHLLCTEENFKKKISPVRAALKNKATKVVVRDWLEDSINRKMCLKTRHYQLDEKAKEEKAKQRELEKREQFSSNAKDYVDERFWHVYRDSTYFEYQIQLTRIDEESGKVREKHLLTLWESNAKPYNYVCTTLFTKSHRKAVRFRIHDSPVGLNAALKKFESFFKKKANIVWDDRIDKVGTTSPRYFQYQPPTGGKPVGLIRKPRASILREEAQHDNGPAKVISAAETPRKRPREESVADHATTNADDAERSAKKSRHEKAETVRVSVEANAGSPEQAIAIDSNSESEESNQSDQDHDEQQPSDRPIQDATSVPGTQPEPSDVVDDGISQSRDESDQEEHNEAEYPEVEDDYYTYDGSVNVEEEEEEEDEEEAHDVSAARFARAAAENIYYETNRGVSLVNDSQAELIDLAYKKREDLRARAERERRRDAEDDSVGSVSDY
ncbi:hypothetical protein F4823DRAFT_635023 [Ustulina deusta]|nr:hypothetical protein F4823DRAFT_635023 [Ustulina deusta]